ncbi:2'-5' RNA ligase family protein [Nocardia tengchongensis]|uniref:2'-5' RNA ligase family protein n=1 Tax=Nocardia tengchongensis TaxID=2055889 RepID=UPI0036B71F4D
MPDRHDPKPMTNGARSGPFPELLPTSLSDKGSIRENDWRAFCAVEQMADHWRRNDWPAGREVYFWYLTFDGPELIHLVEQCRAGISPEGLDFVPLDALHMTMLRIGDCDKVADEEVQAIADEAKSQLGEFDSFALEVGPLAGSRGAIRYTASPWTELFALHHIVRESTRKVLPALSIATTQQFRPHIGIGYSNQEQAAQPLIEQIAALRDIEPVIIHVDAIKIVRLRREPHTYRWMDVVTLSLGPS